MCLSDPTIVGLCYLFGMALANNHVLWSAAETRRDFVLDGRSIVRIIAWSVLWMVSVAAFGWGLGRVFPETGERPRCTSVLVIVLVVWIASALLSIVQGGSRQILAKTGVDVFARTQVRVAVTGSLIGMLSSAVFVFRLV